MTTHNNNDQLQQTVKAQEKLIHELKRAIMKLEQQVRAVDQKASRASEKARVNANELNKITHSLKGRI